MGCCCSKRPDPASEEGRSSVSTRSLRSEIDNKPISPKSSHIRMKSKQPSQRLLKKRSKNWSSQPPSPRDTSKYRSQKTASAYTSRSNSTMIMQDFSQKFIKTPIKVNYNIIRKLQKGTYGDILLSNDKRTEIKNAIKEIKKSAIPPAVHEKFITEIQKFLCIDHPNVVKLHEVYESEESWFLVYEFLSGSNLLYKIQNLSIGSSMACTIIGDILRGLNYCHRSRIFHLRLNLEKVILDSWDGKINCKIIGFSYPWDLETLVKVNDVTCFMAPEVLSGVYNKFASDVWSVGVILYLIVQGKPPFQGKSSKQLLSQYKKQLNFNEEGWVFASNDLKDLLSKMLIYDYNKRITTEEALNHPWIKNNQSLLSPPTHNDTISYSVEFTSREKIVNKLLSFFKISLSSQNDNKEFIEIYKKLDTDKDGQINKEELLNETKNLDTESQKKFEMVLKNAGLIEKDYIEYSDFLTAFTNWNTDENIKKIEKAFNICDKSRDGELSLNELKASIKGIKDKEWLEFFGNVDFDKSGKISLAELKRFLLDENYSSSKQI